LPLAQYLVFKKGIRGTINERFFLETTKIVQKLETGQDGAITQNFYFQFYFNVLDLNIEPKLNINKIGLIKI
jgi:hypothetical protein